MTIDAAPPRVQRALDAANSGHIDSFLDCFTPNGAVDDWGRIFRGREAIRAWSDAEFIGLQVTLSPIAVKTDGATVTISAQVGGNGFNGPSHFTFTLSEERISLMRITG